MELLQQLPYGRIPARSLVDKGGLQHSQEDRLVVVDEGSMDRAGPTIEDSLLVFATLESIILELREEVDRSLVLVNPGFRLPSTTRSTLIVGKKTTVEEL